MTADVPGKILVQSTAQVDAAGGRPRGRGVRMYLTETGLAFDTDPQPLAISYPAILELTCDRGTGRIRHEGRSTSFRCVSPWWGPLPAETRFVVDLIQEIRRDGPLVVSDERLKRLYRLRTIYIFPVVLGILGGAGGGALGAVTMGLAGYAMGHVKNTAWHPGLKLAAYLLCVLGGIAAYLGVIIVLAVLFPGLFRRR
ncbi:MAG: hypothetical protein HY597_03240 [Candidatus Omnitrophica bacterium]|nr:hypothetical protein [Candidatus Omnitrophota bacterium]